MDEWSKKRGIMRRYNKTARFYDLLYAKEQSAKIEAALEKIIVKDNSAVLDVGCGTGLLFDYVKADAKIIVGIDVSREILFKAKERIRTLSNVHLILADADNLPVRDGVFDYVFAITLLQNMPKPLRTLTEIKRASAKNSTIIVTGLKKKFNREDFESLLRKLGLNVIEVKSENLKCHVAICSKLC